MNGDREKRRGRGTVNDHYEEEGQEMPRRWWEGDVRHNKRNHTHKRGAETRGGLDEIQTRTRIHADTHNNQDTYTCT